MCWRWLADTKGDRDLFRGADASTWRFEESELGQPQLNWITNYIWGIADDVLRDLYVRGKYRDVILPMTVLRRLDAVLEDTKQAVLDMEAFLDAAGVVEQESALRQAAGQAFYNTSKFTLRDLKSRASRQQLKADFEAYLDGFSPSVQDILENFEFRNQIPRLSRADALGTLIEKLTSPDINLSPEPVRNADGSIKHAGLDNHGMGSIFEELVRKFNEENNEEAGEHWTPRDAVKLMAKLLFLPIADEIESGTYLLYDGALGTGGMLTVAEETLQDLAAAHGKEVSTHLYGQEINAETYAICKADLLLKGEGYAADNIVGGPSSVFSTCSMRCFVVSPSGGGPSAVGGLRQSLCLSFLGATSASMSYHSSRSTSRSTQYPASALTCSGTSSNRSTTWCTIGTSHPLSLACWVTSAATTIWCCSSTAAWALYAWM